MAKTYSQLLKDIEALTAQAQARKAKEAPGVIAKIKQAIEFYGLTAVDLGLDGASGSAGSRPTAKAARKSAAVKKAGKTQAAGGAKYGDGTGNVWSGRGPRPHWLRDALAGGRELGEFLLGGGSPASSATEAPAAKKRGPAKKAARGTAGKTAAKKSARAARGADSAAPAASEPGAALA